MEKYQQEMWDMLNSTVNQGPPYVITEHLVQKNWYRVTLNPNTLNWLREQDGTKWTYDRSKESNWGNKYVLIRPELLSFIRLKFG